MTWTTDPAIEFAVFIAVCQIPLWKPRFSIIPESLMLGDYTSTLSVFPAANGQVCFSSHEENEILHIAIEVEREYNVQIRRVY
jgi:hypothetical protein